MPRVNVYDYATDEYDQSEPQLTGWFNTDSATRYAEDTDWDGHNQVSVHTGSAPEHQALYLTKGGRWILNRWSQYQGTEDRYEFIPPEQAKEWLVRNHDDDAVTQHFGALEEESGPNLGGRPAVGAKVEVRLPDDLLARLDERAKSKGMKRAEAIRAAIAAALPTPDAPGMTSLHNLITDHKVGDVQLDERGAIMLAGRIAEESTKLPMTSVSLSVEWADDDGQEAVFVTSYGARWDWGIDGAFPTVSPLCTTPGCDFERLGTDVSMWTCYDHLDGPPGFPIGEEGTTALALARLDAWQEALDRQAQLLAGARGMLNDRRDRLAPTGR